MDEQPAVDTPAGGAGHTNQSLFFQTSCWRLSAFTVSEKKTWTGHRTGDESLGDEPPLVRRRLDASCLGAVDLREEENITEYC